MKKIVYLLLVGGILIVFYGYRLYSDSFNYSLNPASEDRVVIDIEKGASASRIAELLSEKGLIKNEFMFKLYLKQHELQSQLKAGRIVFQQNYRLSEIVDALIQGGSSEIAVTLLEGWTASQIGEYLESKGLTTKDAFMNCIKSCKFDFDFLPEGYLEGYLYPDTYFVDLDSYTDQAFINRLISTLELKLTPEDMEAINKSDYSFEEIMIMASIVEREERNADEQPTVAGILWNRYDAGQGLGADATVLYALNRTSGGLTYDDLQINSPYNTRKYRGLPPTPISNPGLSSIRAAIYPERTDYWYYLHDAEGQVHYARSLDEHSANKQKYIY